MYKILIGALTLMASLYSVCSADTGQALQRQADDLRENGQTVEALNLYDQAFVIYLNNKNYEAVLHVLAGRLISWQHLFNQGENKIYAIRARKEAEAMLDIAHEAGIHTQEHLIHFMLGKSCIFLKDFSAAENEFRQAVDLYPHNNAEKGDWMAHLGEAIYRNGRKEEGKNMILQGVQQIQEKSCENDSFVINVWISGAYLRLAKILLNDNHREEALQYFQKGEAIALSDPRLVIRKQQVDLLKNKFSL